MRCDNTQAVAAVTRGATRVRDGKEIALLAKQLGFKVRAVHISGVENVRADWPVGPHMADPPPGGGAATTAAPATSHLPAAVLEDAVPAASGLLLRPLVR